MDEAPHMHDTLARLRAFRETWNEKDQIDEESGLTTATSTSLSRS